MLGRSSRASKIDAWRRPLSSLWGTGDFRPFETGTIRWALAPHSPRDEAGIGAMAADVFRRGGEGHNYLCMREKQNPGCGGQRLSFLSPCLHFLDGARHNYLCIRRDKTRPAGRRKPKPLGLGLLRSAHPPHPLNGRSPFKRRMGANLHQAAVPFATGRGTQPSPPQTAHHHYGLFCPRREKAL